MEGWTEGRMSMLEALRMSLECIEPFMLDFFPILAKLQSQHHSVLQISL